MEGRHLDAFDVTRGARGIESSAPAGFVRVDVAEAHHHPLIHQYCFQRLPGHPKKGR
jgi:hypothetical protein